MGKWRKRTKSFITPAIGENINPCGFWFKVNNIDLLYNRSIVTWSKFATIFSNNFSFNDHSKLSLRFLYSLSAALFLLELTYDGSTNICFLTHNSQNSFRSKCTVSLGAFCLLIQAKVAVLSTLRCIEVSDNVAA